MTKSLFLFLFIVFVSTWLPAPVRDAVALSEADGPKVFTNEDIEGYKSPSDARRTDTNSVLQDDREESRKDKKSAVLEEREMEYWCKRASTCNRKIEDEKEAIKGIGDEIFEAKTKGRLSHKKIAALDKKLEGAKKRLRKAEGALTDLEDEAHRKGAKAGWLRCQL